MVNSYKILGQSCPAGTADTDVYTVPVGKSAVISLISIANLTGAAATYRLAFRKNNASIANEHYHSFAVSARAPRSPTKSSDPKSHHKAMTPEILIGLILSSMVAVIGHFLKSLIAETRQTRETTIQMHVSLKSTTDTIIELQRADKEHSRQILNMIERLVRIEERQGIGRA